MGDGHLLFWRLMLLYHWRSSRQLIWLATSETDRTTQGGWWSILSASFSKTDSLKNWITTRSDHQAILYPFQISYRWNFRWVLNHNPGPWYSNPLFWRFFNFPRGMTELKAGVVIYNGWSKCSVVRPESESWFYAWLAMWETSVFLPARWTNTAYNVILGNKRDKVDKMPGTW